VGTFTLNSELYIKTARLHHKVHLPLLFSKEFISYDAELHSQVGQVVSIMLTL